VVKVLTSKQLLAVTEGILNKLCWNSGKRALVWKPQACVGAMLYWEAQSEWRQNKHELSYLSRQSYCMITSCMKGMHGSGV